MRGDIGNTKDSRTQSEAAADTTMFGFNLLKAARYINLIVGTACVIVCGLQVFQIFSVFSENPLLYIAFVQLQVYLG